MPGASPPALALETSLGAPLHQGIGGGGGDQTVKEISQDFTSTRITVPARWWWAERAGRVRESGVSVDSYLFLFAFSRLQNELGYLTADVRIVDLLSTFVLPNPAKDCLWWEGWVALYDLSFSAGGGGR